MLSFSSLPAQQSSHEGDRQRARTTRLVQIQIRWTERKEGDVCIGAYVCKCERGWEGKHISCQGVKEKR